MSRFRILRWRFRYRLATLLIAITALGVILPVETARRRRAWAIDELRKLGGTVSTRQRIPSWVLQRLPLPSFVLAEDAKIVFILQHDGTLTPTNGVDQPADPPISPGRMRVLASRAGLPPSRVSLGVIPASSTPHTVTSRIAAEFRAAGFASAWQDRAAE